MRSMNIALLALASIGLLGDASVLSAQVMKPVATASAPLVIKMDSSIKPKRVQLLGVYDEQYNPLGGVEIIDLVGEKKTVTDSLGAIPLGWQSRLSDSSAIHIRKIGYQDTLLVLGPMDTRDTMFVLRKVATTLPAVTTTAKFELMRDAGLRSGIADRCEFARVSCVLELELTKRPSAKIFDFLVKTDGVLPSCDVSNSPRKGWTDKMLASLEQLSLQDCVIKMHRSVGTGTCVPTYFLDGQEWGSMKGNTLAQLQDFLPPSRIQAIEVYRSEQPRPLRFEGAPTCGSVVIWTK
jgi:hypothetical protein